MWVRISVSAKVMHVFTAKANVVSGEDLTLFCSVYFPLLMIVLPLSSY